MVQADMAEGMYTLMLWSSSRLWLHRKCTQVKTSSTVPQLVSLLSQVHMGLEQYQVVTSTRQLNLALT